jgi:hypothetical protein
MHTASKSALFSFFYTLLLIVPLLNFSATAATPSVRKSLIKSSNININEKYTFKYCNPLRKKPFDNTSNKKKLLVIGDSQACDFLNSIKENGFFSNYQISMRYIPYQCQPVLSSHPSYFIANKDRVICEDEERTDNLEQARKQIEEANLIIFSARWKIKAAQALSHTIRHLKLKPYQRVVVLGSKSFGKISIRRYLNMSDRELLNIKNKIDEEVKQVNAILRTHLDHRTIFIDQYKLICGSSTDCPVFTGNLELISYDGRHFTKAGARFAGSKVFKNSGLSRM